MLCGPVPMRVVTRLLTFGNQAEDVENVAIGIYQVVSDLGGVGSGDLVFLWS